MFRGARVRCPQKSTHRWIQVVPGIAVLVALLAVPFPATSQIIIDSFSTNQSALTLTFPPAGTTASSSVSGAGILGGERDLSINLTAGVIAALSVQHVSRRWSGFGAFAPVGGSEPTGVSGHL